MTKKERALIKRIEAKFPRDKTAKGEVKIELNGESVCPARDAVDHVEYILGKAARLAEKSGSFRVVKVARAAGGAGKLAGLSDDELDYIEDTDLWFVIPKATKDPTQEFGPCYRNYFRAE